VSRIVIIAANSSWNIANFRGGLIRGLKQAGYEPVAVAPPDSPGDARLAELGIEKIDLHIDRSGTNPFTDLRLLREYRAILKRLKPFAFLGFTIKPDIYGSMAASGLGIPAIPNVTGLGTAFVRDGPLQLIVTWLYRRAFAKVPVVFFQNPDDRQLFIFRRIVEVERTRVLPGSGVDLDHFKPTPPTDGPIVFLLISRLLRDKGVLEYVEAARSLRPTLANARFQLLGPIDKGNRTSIGRADLDRWIEEGVIDYLGSADDVRPYIAAASVVVLPSYYREGVPRSLLEAAAMARPLITTQVPGCREILDDGVNGYVCNVRDPQSLAAVMKKFADLPPEARAEMGAASRRKVQQGFSEQIVVRAYVDALDRLAGAQH
jgi:glycosyltransferase involved in cell wall biosynthesis